MESTDQHLNTDVDPRQSSPVTLRALVTGALLTALLCVMCPASLMAIEGSYMACDFTLAGAHAVFLAFMLLVNVPLCALKRSWAFSAGELITVYLMLAIGSNVTTMGLVGYLLPTPAGLPYYSSPENRWAELVVPYVPLWLMPADETTIRYFFEGLPAGETIPWSPWIVPLVWWSVLLVGLYAAMLGMTAVLRRQWITRERLIFPLAQLPIDMIEREPNRILGPFFRSKMMWIGFAIPFLIYGWNCLGILLSETSGYTLPRISLSRTAYFARGVWRLRLLVSFPVIGFTYLINLPMSFSIWFFSVVQQAERAIFGVVGFKIHTQGYSPYSTGGAILASQGIGAMLMFVLISVWIARAQLRDLVRRAIRNESGPGDDDEPVTPRAALGLLFGGAVLIGAWMVKSGLPWVYAPLFVIVALAIFLAITRIVAESGVPMTRAPMIAPVFMINLFGSDAFGPAGVAALGMTCVWAGDVRTFTMCTNAHAWKLSDSLRIRGRPFVWVMVLAIPIGILVSCWATLKFGYGLGGCNANSWFFVSGPQYPWRYVARLSRAPQESSLGRMLFMGIGASAVWILSILHHQFAWWPIHPIGLPIAQAGPTEWFWFSIFLGWLFKRIIVWLGGFSLYRQARPMFLGMVIGNFGAGGLWFVISLISGVRGLKVPF